MTDKNILDSDLAKLYGVPTSRFNEAVKMSVLGAQKLNARYSTRWEGLIS